MNSFCKSKPSCASHTPIAAGILWPGMRHGRQNRQKNTVEIRARTCQLHNGNRGKKLRQTSQLEKRRIQEKGERRRGQQTSKSRCSNQNLLVERPLARAEMLLHWLGECAGCAK